MTKTWPKKINNGDFEKFVLLIAPALLCGCPGPRNIQESLVCAVLDLPVYDGNIEDIPDFDIQTKLQELSSCADEDTFQMCYCTFFGLSADKDTVIKNIIHHCFISSCLEEIRSAQKGMSTLGVSIVLFFSVSQIFLSHFEP